LELLSPEEAFPSSIEREIKINTKQWSLVEHEDPKGTPRGQQGT